MYSDGLLLQSSWHYNVQIQHFKTYVLLQNVKMKGTSHVSTPNHLTEDWSAPEIVPSVVTDMKPSDWKHTGRMIAEYSSLHYNSRLIGPYVGNVKCHIHIYFEPDYTHK
jgi:hypothetical protein